ncbi:hypothetical protein O181_076960 [Austropuccinia psidii MF-1]|uniref:Uncharacterized protein n=1 Tax=Austropuccinia psidii MF-1 TaxID=1389203 RepID=A0A9Q3FH68_9BASI|nr:hypothetical protein [Austropuccinia psidii MF-1]
MPALGPTRLRFSADEPSSLVFHEVEEEGLDIPIDRDCPSWPAGGMLLSSDKQNPQRTLRIIRSIIVCLSSWTDLAKFHPSSSHQQQHFVNQFNSMLYYHLSVRLGYTVEHSFGSSRTIYPTDHPNRSNPSSSEILSIDTLERALEKTKANQKTMITNAFQSVNNWKDFARVKHSIDRQWKTGFGQLGLIVYSRNPHVIGRWKFDADHNYWAFNTKSGQLKVGQANISQPGCSRKWITSVIHRHSHLEASGPYLVATNRAHEFLIWKKFDNSSDIDYAPANLFQQQDLIDDKGRRIGWEKSNSTPIFKLSRIIHTPQLCLCFKARAPYLATGSMLGRAIYVWDMQTGELVEKYDVAEASWMSYIELDQNYIFLAESTSLGVYDRKSRRLLYRLGPTLNFTPREWAGIHHDVQGGHLVALSHEAQIIWSPRYNQGFQSDKFVVMSLAHPNVAARNVCVENGRAAFSLVWFDNEGMKESIFLLNLRAWTDYADFMKNPPQLIVVVKMVPSIEPTSRIEMDSCAIYFNTSGPVLDRDNEMYDCWKTSNQGKFSTWDTQSSTFHQPWLDSRGQVLCDHHILDPHPQVQLDSLSRQNWVDATALWNNHLWDLNGADGNWCSSIFKYTFYLDHKDIADKRQDCTFIEF